jgi:hypothetical protein
VPSAVWGVVLYVIEHLLKVNQLKTNYFKYTLVTLVAVVASWELHEFAHWLAGSLLGYEMKMTLNTTYPAMGYYLNNDAMLVSAAGPLITLVQAFVFYFLLKRTASIIWFPFLFVCFYMRLLAAALSFVNLNDEARISHDLGWGTFTLPVVVTALLFYLVFRTVKERKISAGMVLLTTLLTLLISSAIILTDQALHRV